MAGWLGSVTTNLGQAMELTVIARRRDRGGKSCRCEGKRAGSVVGAAVDRR